MLQAVVIGNPEKILATLGGKRNRASSLRVPERQSQGLLLGTEGGFLLGFACEMSNESMPLANAPQVDIGNGAERI